MFSPVSARKLPWHLILIFSLLSAGILAIGYFYYSYEQFCLKQEKLKELTAIADLKVMQIVEWRKERIADAIPVMSDSLFAARVQEWLAGSTKPDLQDEILQHLKGLLINQYQNIILLDPQGDVRLAAVEGERSLGPDARTLAMAAMRTRQVVFSDFYRLDGSSAVRLSVLVPLLLSQRTGEECVGALLMRIDPYQFLYPLVRSWPTPSGSGETVLVRREGDEVLVLNELRHHKDTALTLRFPLVREKLPVVQAAQGQLGTIEGLDYRNVPVVAIIGRIPDSPWHFVTKIDALEIYASLRERSHSVLILLLLLITVAGGSLAIIWSNQQSHLYHRLYEMELDRQKALRKFNAELMQYMLLVQDLYNSAPCGYHSLDTEGTFVQINDTELAWLGYSRDEVVGKMKFSDLLTDDCRKAFQDNFAIFREQGHISGLECNLVRKEGTAFPVLFSATGTKDDSGKYLMSRVTLFDITERLRAERVLKESEERLRYLASQLLNAQERERARIAHELHDDLGQSLLLLKLQLSTLTQNLPLELEKSRRECFNSIDNVQEIIDSVRRLSQDLIPPTLTEIGLKAALNDLLDEFSRRQSITCSADIDEMKGLFSPTTELNIYRMLQESLTNIGKYARATQVSVAFKRNDHEVWFSVEDNGIGFEVDKILARRGRKRGLGLGSLEERARMMGGTFHIWSKPSLGTKIHLTMPLKNEALI